MTFFDNLKQAFTKRELTELQEYRAAVAAIAQGRELDPVDVIDILRNADKSPDDLQADAAELRHRLDLRRIVQEAEQAAARRPEILAAITKADRKLQTAEEKHAAEVDPLAYELERIDELARRADTAKRELALECPDADLTGEQTAADAELQRIEQQRQKLADHKERLRLATDELQAWIDKAKRRGIPRGREEQRLELQRLAKLAEQLAGVEHELAKLAERRDELKQRQNEIWTARGRA